MPTFVFNDETILNTYGFMVANAGGKFDRFNQNPVMLHLHEQKCLTGKWSNLRVEGTKLLADPVFDEDDAFSKDIKGKVDRGFLNGASMGILPIAAELREVPGKGLVAVLIEWELLEGSTCPVPSNAMSLRLYNKNGEVLTALDEIKLSIDTITNNKPKITESMEKFQLTAAAATALNLTAEAAADAINAAIIKMAADKDAALNELKGYKEANAKSLVDAAIKSGKLTADKRESFEKMAVSDYNQAKDVIDALPAKMTFSDKIKPAGQNQADDRDGWDYMKWAKEDPRGLQKMSTEEPERFANLKANYKKA